MKSSSIPFVLMLVIFPYLTSCAAFPARIPAGERIIERVPYFEQEDFQCGPASLATVINYWYIKNNSNERLSIDAIITEVFSTRVKGVLSLDLELYARKLGFNSLQYSGAIEEIKRNIDENAPVIILVDYGVSFFQQNHFMVAKGYTWDGIIFNSGRRENHLILNESLIKIWKKTGFWILVIKP